jgi:hypothetical protein
MIDKAKDNTPVTLLRYPPVVSTKILLTLNQHPITNSIRLNTSVLIFPHLCRSNSYYYHNNIRNQIFVYGG